MTGDVAQGAAETRAAAEGFRVFSRRWKASTWRSAGVNIDEEAVRMITFQRAFQASARVISTINEMLDILVNL